MGQSWAKTVSFSTGAVRAREQYDAWRGWHNQTFEGSPGLPAADGFLATSRAVTLDGLALVRVAMPAAGVLRTRKLIRRNPVDHWTITVALGAQTRLKIGDSTIVAPPRAPFVLSLADEVASDRGADERLQLYLSRDAFRDLAPVLDAARGSVVSGAMGALLADFIEALDRNLGALDLAAAERLKGAIGAMIAACLPAGRRGDEAAVAALDPGRLERVRRLVRQDLRSSELGPEALCRMAGMSRSALYRLMESEGGVNRYIRRERLQAARAALADPLRGDPIAAIAEEFCFGDAADFSRAFRRQFGVSPSDVRAAAKAGLAPSAIVRAPAETGEQTFNDFIRRL